MANQPTTARDAKNAKNKTQHSRENEMHRSLLNSIPRYCILLAYSAVFEHSFAAERADRPNIVLIVADDLGYGELGCYGQQFIQTPRLDELAREGVRFTQFYSGAPVCAPARCMLLTGKHSGHAAIRNNRQPTGKMYQRLSEKFAWEYPGQQPLPAEESTIAELLKARGYITAGIGKWGLGQVGTPGDPNEQGFDLFYGFFCQYQSHNHYPRFLWRNHAKELLPGNDGTSASGATYAQDRFTEEAIKFLREHRDSPFFLYLPFIIPHLSIQVPEASLAQYEGKIPEAPYEHRSAYARHRSPRAGYAAMISHMDRAIGRIVDLIEELGISDKTLVLFTSDNGPTFERLGGADSDFFGSSGPLRGRKGTVYEGGIRVPLIARWRGRVPPGNVTGHVAAFWDVLPTLCEISHTDVPDGIDGMSFAPTIFGEAGQREHEYLYWEFPPGGGQQAVRAGEWKAVRTNMIRGTGEFELYNLARDAGESRDVAADHLDIVRRLAKMAEAAHTPSRSFPLLPIDARIKN
jgi:arylsulfatase